MIFFIVLPFASSSILVPDTTQSVYLSGSTEMGSSCLHLGIGMYSLTLLHAVFMLLLPLIRSEAWSVQDLPNPQNDPRGRCNRNGLKSVVCDPDGYLSKDEADTIDGLATFIYEGKGDFSKFSCPGGSGGVQIAVAVVERMLTTATDLKSAAFDFSRSLHDQWGVGDPACENGVVLLFSILDRTMGISTGQGLKGTLKDEHVNQIMMVIREKMQNAEYGAGIIEAVTAVGRILSGLPIVQTSGMSSLLLFAIITAIFIIVSSIMKHRQQRRVRNRYRRCRHVLERIDEDRDRAHGDTSFVATSCPICLEDFPTNVGTPTSKVNTSEQQSTELSAQTVLQNNVGASGSNTAAQGSDPAKTLILRCGHKFHADCIMKWVSGANRVNAMCPICRKKIDEEPSTSTPQTGTSENQEESGRQDHFDDEYRFRLHRARFYFPDFITFQMVNEWERNRAYRHGTRYRLATSPLFRAADPIVRAQSVGRSGASFSFGGGGYGSGRGGSSRGGGGGGASW